MKKFIALLLIALVVILPCEARRRWTPVISSGFTPPSGTFGWFKADALALSNNDPVVTWTDSSSAGNNVTQGNASFRPVYKTSQQNSLPAVLFDGSNDYLQSSTFTAQAQTNTIYMVFKCVSTGASQFVFDGRDLHRHMCYYNSGGFEMSAYAGSFMNGTGSSYTDTNFHQVTITFAGASSTIFIDGAAQGTGDVGSQDIDAITLGASGDIGAWGNVIIGEILAVHATRSTTVEAYLKAKWATP